MRLINICGFGVLIVIFLWIFVLGSTVVGNYVVTTTFSEDELLDLVPEKDSLEAYVTDRTIEVIDGDGTALASCGRGAIFYVLENRGKRSQVRIYFWIWVNSTRRDGQHVFTNMKENMRSTANGAKIGKVYKDSTMRFIYMNSKESWQLVSLKGWIENHDLEVNRARDYLADLLPIKLIRVPATSRAGGVVQRGMFNIWEPLVSLLAMLFAVFSLLRSRHLARRVDKPVEGDDS